MPQILHRYNFEKKQTDPVYHWAAHGNDRDKWRNVVEIKYMYQFCTNTMINFATCELSDFDQNVISSEISWDEQIVFQNNIHSTIIAVCITIAIKIKCQQINSNSLWYHVNIVSSKQSNKLVYTFIRTRF